VSQHLPSLQCPEAHSTPPVHSCPFLSRQAEAALQVLFPPHSGASSMETTNLQVPVGQLLQGSVQAWLQQTPSLQNPVAHSPAEVQDWPGLGLH